MIRIRLSQVQFASFVFWEFFNATDLIYMQVQIFYEKLAMFPQEVLYISVFQL